MGATLFRSFRANWSKVSLVVRNTTTERFSCILARVLIFGVAVVEEEIKALFQHIAPADATSQFGGSSPGYESGKTYVATDHHGSSWREMAI